MTETGSKTAVSFRGVSRTYRPAKGQQVAALREVDLDVAAGRAVAVVGASGAGKSTLLHLVGAMDRSRLRAAPTELSSLRRSMHGCQAPRGTRCLLPEREHCLGDLAGCRIGDRGGSLFEDEQPCPGDLARDCLAVADGEERVPAAVDDEGGDLDLG